MPLSPDTRLGSYRITAQIGAGGMGEVYRARDLALERDVAITVLPENVAQDPERLARFEREARTLAALNHPNIAQIYGLERSGSITALVMEPRGKPADKRADIWSFGVVQFEMLSGHRLFEGENVSETLAFVLTTTPDWSKTIDCYCVR